MRHRNTLMPRHTFFSTDASTRFVPLTDWMPAAGIQRIIRVPMRIQAEADLPIPDDDVGDGPHGEAEQEGDPTPEPDRQR
jgi:hypothetical protein